LRLKFRAIGRVEKGVAAATRDAPRLLAPRAPDPRNRCFRVPWYTIEHAFSGTYADLAINSQGQIFVIPPRPPAVTDLSFVSLDGINYTASFPKHFGLSVRGSEGQGATVTATLRKPRALALIVRAAGDHRLATVGVVHLGEHPAGVSNIHWDLEVAPARPLRDQPRRTKRRAPVRARSPEPNHRRGAGQRTRPGREVSSRR